MTDLDRATRQVIESYLHDVRAALRQGDADVADEAVKDLEAHLLGALDAGSTPGEARTIVDALGTPEPVTRAARLSAADELGDVLGVPYEVRVPTGERVASRWWNPADPRLFMPRVWGMGWDLNMGALAVKLGLIEPDAEDEPFALAPDGAFVLALVVPVALTVITIGTYVALRDRFPAQLPVHWDWRGEPDDFAAAIIAFAPLFMMAVLPTTWAAWLVARGRSSRPAKGGAIGFATFLSTLATGVWLQTVAEGVGKHPPAWTIAAIILAAVAIPLAVFTGLARSGRAAEQRRDMAPRGR